MVLNLRELADQIEVRPFAYVHLIPIREAADKAEKYAFDLNSLIDGQDDDLADLLTPIVEFLKSLSGIKDLDSPVELTPTVSPVTVGDETNRKRPL